MAMIENVTPILRVADLGARRRYYRQTLGFSLDWDADPMISVLATANRSCCAKANRASQASGSESASRTLMCCSPNFRQTARTSESAPQNFDWAYEFQVEDPDGHVLRIGSEPKPGPTDRVFKS